MSQNLKQKYTVELNLEVKTAEAQVKKLATNINNIWADMGKASNKFAVLKDLADYLELIDSKIADLKGTDLNLFNKIFGTDGANINAALKQTIEPILKSPELIADAMKTAQTKLKAIQENPNAKGTAAGLREIGSAINQMYKLIGQESPINIEEQLVGGKTSEKLALLTKHLDAFEVKWKDVLATVGSGSGVSGTGNAIAAVSAEVQEEIDQLKQQIDELKEMRKTLKKTAQIVDDVKSGRDQTVLDDYKTDVSIDSVKELINQFDKLQSEIESGDKSSAVYFNNLMRLTDIAFTLKKALQDVRANSEIKQLFQDEVSGNGDTMLGRLSLYATSKSTGVFNQVLSANKNKEIDHIIDDNMSKIKDLQDNAMVAGEGVATAFARAGQHVVSATEYIRGMTTAIREMFDVLSKASDIEYKALMGGQDIAIKAGSDGEVSSKSTAAAYLANLMQDTDVDIHSHQGKGALINAPDVSQAIKRRYSGLTKISAIIGRDDITTLDLTKVKAEDAAIALNKLREVTKQQGKESLSVEEFNKIFTDINPRYANIAQSWDPSRFGDLATYIYNVKKSAEQSFGPLEKLKNLLSSLTDGKKIIDFSKYDDLLKTLSKNNVHEIFNHIAKAEGIAEDGETLQLQPEDVSTMSVDGLVKDIQRQKDELADLRKAADITYQHIAEVAERYSSTRHTTNKEGLDFFKQYFHASELEEIDKLFEDKATGKLKMPDVVKNIASRFNIEAPSQTEEAIEQSAEEKAEAINYAKKILTKAYQDYYKATERAREQGVVVEDGETTEEMDNIQDSIADMVEQWKPSTAQRDNKGQLKNAQYELAELYGYIQEDAWNFDEIGEKINAAFDDNEITLGIPLDQIKEQAKAMEGSFDHTEDAAQRAAVEVNRFNKVVQEIRQNGIESSDSANYYEGQLDAIKEHIDELYELEAVSDEVMDQIDRDYKEMQDSYIGYARGRENVYNELSALNNRATLTDDKDELTSIVQKRQELINLAEEAGYFDDDALETQKAITAEIEKRINAEKVANNDAANKTVSELYDSASSSVRGYIDQLVLLEEQQKTVRQQMEATKLEGFNVYNMSDDQKSFMLQTFEKYKQIKAQIDAMPLIETEDDKQRLTELQIELVQLGKTLRQVRLPDGDTADYARLFGLSNEEAWGLRQAADVRQDITSDMEHNVLEDMRAKYNATFNAIYDEYVQFINRINNKPSEWEEFKAVRMQALKKDETVKSEGTDSGSATDEEVARAKELLQIIRDLKTAIDEKTAAFREEADTVDSVVEQEITSLEKLRSYLEELRDLIQTVFSGNETEKSAFDQESSDLNRLKDAIFDIETAVNNKTDAFRTEATVVEQIVDDEVSSLSRLESAINSIEYALDSAFAADRKLNLPEVKTSSVATTENPHYVTDPQGKPVIMYRGIHGAYGGLVSNRYHGGTFSTDNLELAKEYAGELGKVEKVLLSMKKPLEIEGNGALWNQIEYIGTSSDKTSRRLHELQSELSAVNELIKEYEQIQPTNKENDLIRKGLIIETEAQRKLRGFVSEKARLESEKKAIFADSSNPYGIKNTNQIVEIAKAEGFDGVIFKNIIDSATGAVNDMSNVMVTFEQNQIHYVETIGATLDNALNLLKQKLGPFADYINAAAEEISDAVVTASALEQKLSVGEITQDEYNKLSADNLVLKDLATLSQRLGTTPDFIKKELLSGDSFSLETLEGVINSFFVNIRERLQNIATTFGVDDIPLNDLLNSSKLRETSEQQVRQDKINADSTPNLLQSIDQILGQILAVLQGFTGIESDNKNSIKVKEPVPEVSVGTSDAYELLANKLPDGIATESTLGAIRGSVEQIASLLKTDEYVKPNAGDVEDLSSVASATDVVADNLKDIVYHAGDLSNISNTLKTLPLGNFKPSKMESTFNGFTGLYTTENFEHLSGNEWEGAPISTIDLSQYKMFNARSDELATKAKDFFNDLNSVIYGYLDVFDYDAFDMAKATNTISIEELYTRFGQVFRDVQMDFNEFKDFIENAQAVVKGHEFNEIEIPDLDEAASKFGTGTSLQGVSKDVFNSDTFQTQLLKRLGFEGIDLRGTKYNSAYTGGTVVFDVKPESIKSVNEKWTDVARRNYPENDFWYSPEALAREERRRQIAFETAEAYNRQADSAREQAQYESISEEDVANAREQLQVERQITAEQREQAAIAVTTENPPPPTPPGDGSALVANPPPLPDDSSAAAGGTPPPDGPNEVASLERLSEAVEKAKTAVDAKTEAFREEGRVVDQVVAQEIAALQSLINKLAEVKSAVEAKTDAFATEGAAVNDAVIKDKSAIETEANADNIPAVQREAQAHQDNADAIREETAAQQDLNAEKQKQNERPKKRASKKKLTPEERNNRELQKGALKKYDGELDAIIGQGRTNHLDFNYLSKGLHPEQQEIAKLYTDTKLQIKEYIDAVEDGAQVEASSIQNSIALLREKVRVYKDQNNLTDTGRVKKTNRYDGSNVISTRNTQHNNIQNRIGENPLFANSTVLTDAVSKYESAWSKLQGLYTKLQNMPNPTKDDEANFKAASAECNRLGKEVEKLLNAYDKMNSDPTKVGSRGLIDYNNRAKELQDYIADTYGNDAIIGDFKNNWNELLFTINKGNGEFVKAKVAIDNLGTSIIETNGDAEKATSKFGKLFGDLGSKFKGLWVYASARFGVDEIIQAVRTGVQYVREIDTALTELKKVTNETGATYDAFLQKMSKTAGVVGSTVKDLTTMAAEWSRLGYSLEEAGKLAESTAILLNVSEFDDATQASEALISTMQAFQYTADESGHVVDILNEVGNNYAVSSDGIATALKDSASALMEGGNNLEQATALVAAAMKNWLFI